MTGRGRIVRSSAHDWKSCIPQGIEGSNPSLSATAGAARHGRLLRFRRPWPGRLAGQRHFRDSAVRREPGPGGGTLAEVVVVHLRNPIRLTVLGLGAVAVLPGVAAAATLAPDAGLAQVDAPALGTQVLRLLADPNVAYLLFVVGVLSILAELVLPGATYPGLVGAGCLIMSLIGFGQLDTNWGGLALVAVGAAMFLLDLQAPGHGLSVVGVLLFAIGPLLMFTPFWQAAAPGTASVSPWIIAGTALGLGAFFGLGVASGLRAQSGPPAMGGKDHLLGMTGTVRKTLSPDGLVHVDGEEWSARLVGGGSLAAGARVRVTGMHGLTLDVEPLAGG
jgi:membrane-bound ClpP family serine protease